MVVEHRWESADLSMRKNVSEGVHSFHFKCVELQEGMTDCSFFLDRIFGTFLIEKNWFYSSIRIGLVARICRSQSSKDDQFRQGQGSIP
jgi:hypothetical protein